MSLVADVLLAAGAFGAAVYCYVLSARLTRLQTLESGMGGAIAVLSAQVDEMTRALEKARAAALAQTADLEAKALRGEAAAARLDVILSTLSDVPQDAGPAPWAPRRPAAEAAPPRRFRVERSRASHGAPEARA
jgi:hypothetical protein